MTVSEMVRRFLEESGYDGLFNSGGECGCELADLFPCGGDSCLDCEPGYKRRPTAEEGSEFDFIIAPEKPEPRLCSCKLCDWNKSSLDKCPACGESKPAPEHETPKEAPGENPA